MQSWIETWTYYISFFIQQKAATLQAATREPTSAADTEAFEVASSHECPRCSSYQVQISNQIQELKNKDNLIERLKKDSKNLTAQLTSTKVTCQL